MDAAGKFVSVMAGECSIEGRGRLILVGARCAVIHNWRNRRYNRRIDTDAQSERGATYARDNR